MLCFNLEAFYPLGASSASLRSDPDEVVHCRADCDVEYMTESAGCYNLKFFNSAYSCDIIFKM